jgi:hypothetical protein
MVFSSRMKVSMEHISKKWEGIQKDKAEKQ